MPHVQLITTLAVFNICNLTKISMITGANGNHITAGINTWMHKPIDMAANRFWIMHYIMYVDHKYNISVTGKLATLKTLKLIPDKGLPDINFMQFKFGMLL